MIMVTITGGMVCTATDGERLTRSLLCRQAASGKAGAAGASSGAAT